MISDRFIFLISRNLSGDITPEEKEELKNLLKEDALLQQKQNVFQQMLAQQEKDKQPDVEKALEKVWKEIEENKGRSSDKKKREKQSRRHFNWFAGIAASVAFLAGFGFLSVTWKEKQTIANTTENALYKKFANVVEKQNTKGIRSFLILSDGSKIWLNADSKLEYPDVFEGRTREVYLSGEAFFEVAKNPACPFIIHLDNGFVRVLGTSFNVKAYKGARIIETSVSTGRVAFIPKKKKELSANDTVFLTHDTKAVYSIATGEIKTLSTSSNDDKAWTEDRLIFKSLSFEEIAIELERTFGKKVVFTDENIKQYKLTGSFENNSLDKILYYLSLSKPFAYYISDKEIVIGKVLP